MYSPYFHFLLSWQIHQYALYYVKLFAYALVCTTLVWIKKNENVREKKLQEKREREKNGFNWNRQSHRYTSFHFVSCLLLFSVLHWVKFLTEHSITIIVFIDRRPFLMVFNGKESAERNWLHRIFEKNYFKLIPFDA